MRKHGMSKLSAELRVTEMPEALAALRRDMARLLRDEAERGWAESPEQNVIDIAVRRSLRRVADAFEAGLTRVDEVSHGG